MAEPHGDTKNVVSSESKLLHYTARALAVVVAGGSAVLSFNALTALATAAGIAPSLAWMWAIVVDGFILIATISIFALRKRGRRALAWPFFILGLFVVISIIGNGLHPALEAGELKLSGAPGLASNGHLPFWAAAIVTAVPPVALFLAIHLIFIMITPSKAQEKLLEREAKQAERAKIKPGPTPAPAAGKPAFPRTIIQVPPTPTVAIPEASTTVRTDVEPDVESETSQLVFTQPAELTVTDNEPVGNPVMNINQLSDLDENELELAQRILAGEKVTGQDAADAYGVTLRTGQGKLKKLREKLAA